MPIEWKLKVVDKYKKSALNCINKIIEWVIEKKQKQ